MLRILSLVTLLLPALTLATSPIPDKCALVLCPQILCPSGQVPYTPSGECCQKCKTDCRLVRCGAYPDCPNGQIVTPEDGCCPVCIKPTGPDCSLVRCALPVCDDGVLVKPKGKCCYECQRPDCSAVQCLAVQCPYGSETPKGQCCPVCKPRTTITRTIITPITLPTRTFTLA